MGDLIFVTGPVRSGKSRWAVERAGGWGPRVAFVATYRLGDPDPEMETRVARHRAERPGAWRTLEAPGDVAAALTALPEPPSGVLMDCLTLWAADRMHLPDTAIEEAWQGQLEAFGKAPWPILIVGNEVGWSLVPEDPSLRRFRDLAGRLGQATAAAAREAWLLVAGCPLRLK